MYKIAVLGDKDSILGFKAVGIDVFTAKASEEAESILEELVKTGYAIIFVTEQIAKDIVPAIASHSEDRIPAIIPIPGNQGSLGIGMEGIKKCVERAIGADILFKD